MTKCPVCLDAFDTGDYAALAGHLLDRSGGSDAGHVAWLRDAVSLHRVDAEELTRRLVHLFELPAGGLTEWMRRVVALRFFGTRPHPFVAALQHPAPATLRGWVIEDSHLRPVWSRMAGFVVARADRLDAARLAVDRLWVDLGSDEGGAPSHYELMLRMGESVGVARADLAAMEALPTTHRVAEAWLEMAESEHWLDTLAALQAPTLLTDPTLREFGARVPWINPAILTDGSLAAAAVEFLRESSAPEVTAVDRSLELLARYAREFGRVEEAQGSFLRSVDLLDDGLVTRLERGGMHGPAA